MRIRWEVADGYINAASFDIDIDDDELSEYESLEDKIEFISEIIQEDFEQRVSWSSDIKGCIQRYDARK